MTEEKEFNPFENIEIGEDEPAIEKLRRDAPVMANFVEAVQDQMNNLPIPKAWQPPKLEFCIRQLKFGTDQLPSSISKLLNDGWEVFKTESYQEWLVVIFARKVEKVDS